MRHSLPASVLIAISVTALEAQGRADENSIREARAQSNAAIARHDAPGIAKFWMQDIHITTSTSAQAAGIATNQERMAQQFVRRPDTIYVRTPSTIEVFAAWAVASERGEWVGRWTEPDGALEIRGTYLAQWRLVDGRWLIQSELYVPTRCKGSAYCSRHP
jgi:ketosteroid isomerase-like protein